MTTIKRFLIVVSVLTLVLNQVFAVPAYRGWQEQRLTDGSLITLRQVGDEFYHHWETKDGKIAIMQDNGTFIVTNENVPTSEQIARRRAKSNRYVKRAKMVGAGYMPTRALFILVSFSNQTFKSTSETYYKSKLGDSSEGAMSMYNYLKLQSNGQYAPPVDVYGPYTLSNTYATYGANDSSGDDVNPAQMIVDACRAANDDIDFSQYDGNNDGKVDNVYVIYAGKGEADGGSASTVWPHQWDISSGGLSLTLDGKSIRNYACSAELNGSGNCAMGTPLHEFGHVIGLPDYYDTEYASTNYTESRTPGEWSIMDQGSYNNNGNTPPNYSIFDKYYLGWATPKFLAKDEKKNVTMTTGWDDAYQITGGASRVAATATSPATIYYIENRQKSGWDAYLPGHGMIVWQVKYNSTAWNNNTLNNSGGNPRYTVLSASGNPKNIGKNSDPFPGSNSVTSCTPVSGCAMSDITEIGNNITFKYNGGVTTIYTVTWSVQGSTTSETFADGATLVVPSPQPSDCSVTGGKKFVGWTEQSSISNGARPSDLFTSGSGKTVTGNKTYYAVYATASEGGGGASIVTLNASSDTSFPKDGITLTTSNGVLNNGTDYRIYKGATLTITSSVGNMSSIAFTFDGSYDGGGWETSYAPNSNTWTSPACTSGSSGKQARITQIIVTMAGGGTSYSDYSLTCGAPCSNTPVMSFTNATINKTTADASYTQAVTISGKGSGQTVAYSSSDETIAIVNNSGVVTLKGEVGSTIITASVEANGTYCAASASYTLNVTAAPIDVTLYYNGTSASLTNQTSPYTLPTGAPYNADMCEGDWTFAGWYGSTYTKSETEPSYISQLTATGSAYAIYTTTETSGSGGSTNITLNANTDTSFPKDGITLTTSNGVLNNGTDYRIYKGATLTITSSVGNISSIAFTFDGSYNGGGWETSYTPNSSTWTSPACTSGSSGKQARITQIIVTVAGGGSSTTYYATSPDCVTPCSITPTMSFSAPTTVSKTTADVSFTKAVTIENKGSGQTVAYSSSDETVAVVNNSGVVTLQGKVGSTTITASVEASGTYCAASASYTLNVSAAPIDVTLYYNGTSASLTNQTSPYTLPTGAPYNTAMCSGDWTFAGWYGSAYSKSTEAPSYIAELNATGSAYAVYTTTETSGSGGAGGSVTITTSTANIPTSYGSANTFTEYTLEGYKFKIQQMYLNGGKLQWRAAGNSSGTGTMYNNETFPGKITSIVLTYNSSDANKNFTVKVGDSANPSSGTSITPSISGSVYTFDCSSANADYFVLTNGSGAGYLDQIVINYGGGSSSTTYFATSPDCAPTTTYTVTWKACGEVFKSETYAEGAALVLPDPAPEDNAGKSFYGWTETEHHTGASAPADAFTTAGSKTVTSDVTYYAIYY